MDKYKCSTIGKCTNIQGEEPLCLIEKFNEHRTMRNFEQWHADLVSDQLWYELLRAYKDETIRKASEKVYAQLVADKTVDLRPVSENRKHVYNIVCKGPGDKPKGKSWSEIALEKQVQKSEAEEEWKPVSEEERGQWLEKWKESIAHLQTVNAVPRIGYKQSIEEGGWLPPKQAPYPCTSFNEAFVKERHLEYIRQNYEPRTGEPLPSWIPEEQFNQTIMNPEQISDIVEPIAKEFSMDEKETLHLKRYFIYEQCKWIGMRGIGMMLSVSEAAVSFSIKKVKTDEKYRFAKNRIKREIQEAILLR